MTASATAERAPGAAAGASSATAGHSGRPRVVLYWEGNIDGTIGGSQIFMHDLITHLDPVQFRAIAGFSQDNAIADKFRSIGVETVVYRKIPALDVHRMIGSRSGLSRALVTMLLPLQKAINLATRFVIPVFRHAWFLRRRGVDLIDLNNSITRNHELMLAAMIARVPCITHEAGINHAYSWGSRFFHARLAAVICCSHAIAANMKKHGLDHRRLPVIHSCVSGDRMRVLESPAAVRQRHGLGSRGPVIGVVGNIRGWKGQETVVRATALLRERWPEIVCLLVGKVGAGDEPFYEGLKRLIEELGITGNVVFTGYHPNPADYMNVMDVVIHSSTHPEPFGMVNLEAMGLGKPVVATNIGGPVEVFEDGRSGILVTPGDPGALADAVGRLLSDREFASRIGEAARLRRATHFRLEDTVAKTQAVYRDVLSLPVPST